MKPIEFLGIDCSPYSMKMLSYLRYRRIPHAMVRGDMSGPEGYPKPKFPMLPTFYLPDSEGNLHAAIDSTPIMRRFENEYSERKALPEDPVVSFFVDLVEDFADEWLTKLMYHYRWAVKENAEQIAPKMLYWVDPKMPSEKANHVSKMFAQRQIERLKYVGSNEITSTTIEASYERMIGILEQLISNQGFVFGDKPSTADFAIFGQFSQLTKEEPTSSRLCTAKSPRLSCWINVMSDLAGLPIENANWLTAEQISQNLKPLFEEIGKTYAPLIVANKSAIDNGEKQFTTEIYGKPWQQMVFPYQTKCLDALHSTFAHLCAKDQAIVSDILAGTGCEVFIVAS